MTIAKILEKINTNPALSRCRLSPETREAERKKLAEQVEAFLNAGNEITNLTTQVSTTHRKAA